MSIFDKNHSKTLYQGDIVLPPTWVNQQNKQQAVEQSMNTVCISGTQRLLADNVITLLQEAKEMAVLCSFLLADKAIEDAIVSAAERGIRVYLMLASEAKLDEDLSEDDWTQEIVQQHRDLLKRLGGKVHIRSAAYYHAKVILTDPFGEHAKGFMMTANMTKEAIERNEEMGLMLTKAEVIEMRGFIHWAIWEAAEHEMVDNTVFRSVTPLKQIPHPTKVNHIFATTPDPTATNATGLHAKALEVIGNAKQQIIIACYGWQVDHPVVEALVARAQTGFDITILTRTHRTKTMPALLKLAKAGATVWGFRWLHAKAIWADNNTALIMSANIEKHGLDTGFELGVYLQDDRATMVHQYLVHWVNQAKWLLTLERKLGSVLGPILTWHQGKLEYKEIKPQITRTLDELTVTSILQLDKEPKLPALFWFTDPYHQVQFDWCVKAPILSKNSKEQFQEVENKTKAKDEKKTEKPTRRPYDPPVYKEPNGRQVIAIDSPAQLTSAIALSKTVKATAIVVRTTGEKR